MRMKTNRLSTLRASSTTYPVTNSSALVGPSQWCTRTANPKARATQNPLLSKACRNGMTRPPRFHTARSRKSNTRMTALKMIQKLMCMGRDQLQLLLNHDPKSSLAVTVSLLSRSTSRKNEELCRQLRRRGRRRCRWRSSSAAVEQTNGLQDYVTGDLHALGAQLVDRVFRSVVVCVLVSVVEVNNIRYRDTETGKRHVIVGNDIFRSEKVRLVAEPGSCLENNIFKPRRGVSVAQDVQILIPNHVRQQKGL